MLIPDHIQNRLTNLRDDIKKPWTDLAARDDISGYIVPSVLCHPIVIKKSMTAHKAYKKLWFGKDDADLIISNSCHTWVEAFLVNLTPSQWHALLEEYDIAQQVYMAIVAFHTGDPSTFL